MRVAVIACTLIIACSAWAETDADKAFDRAIRPVERTGCKEYWSSDNRRSLERVIKACTRTLERTTWTDLQRAYAFHVRGMASAVADKLPEALADLDQAIALNASYAPSFYERAYVHQRQRAMNKAAADFKKSVDLGNKGAEYPLSILTQTCPSLTWDGETCLASGAAPLSSAGGAAGLGTGIGLFSCGAAVAMPPACTLLSEVLGKTWQCPSETVLPAGCSALSGQTIATPPLASEAPQPAQTPPQPAANVATPPPATSWFDWRPWRSEAPVEPCSAAPQSAPSYSNSMDTNAIVEFTRTTLSGIETDSCRLNHFCELVGLDPAFRLPITARTQSLVAAIGADVKHLLGFADILGTDQSSVEGLWNGLAAKCKSSPPAIETPSAVAQDMPPPTAGESQSWFDWRPWRSKKVASESGSGTTKSFYYWCRMGDLPVSLPSQCSFGIEMDDIGADGATEGKTIQCSTESTASLPNCIALIGPPIRLSDPVTAEAPKVAEQPPAPASTPAPAAAPPTLSPSEIANANFLVLETSKGKVLIKLRPDLAPKHVERFRLLVANEFYNGVLFHRVIPGFMAQTGDRGAGRSQFPDVQAEFSSEPFRRGTVGAAREAGPDTANSQFFICLTDTGCASLTGQYTIWGNVIEGMDAIDQLAAGEPPADADYVRSIVLQSGTDPAPSPDAPSPNPAPAVAVTPPAPAPEAPAADVPLAGAPQSPVAAGGPPIPPGCPIDQDFGGWTVRRGSLQGVPVVTTGNSAGYSGTATKWSMDSLSLELIPTKQGKWLYFMFAKNLKYAGTPMTEITGTFGASIWDGATKQGFSGFQNKSGGGTVYQAPYVVIGLPPFYIDEAIDKIESLQSVNFSLVMPTEAGKLTDVHWINPFQSSGLRAAMAAAQACAVE